MKTADVSDRDVLEFLSKQIDWTFADEPQYIWSTHGEGYSMPTVQDAMPAGTPEKVQLAKMRALLRRGFVRGCGCGCRGDWVITDKGLDFLRRSE